MSRTKRTFDNFKKAVARESVRYPYLKKNKGEFNENYLRASFDAGQTAIECCNSMMEVV